jgi:hypothetical protein
MTEYRGVKRVKHVRQSIIVNGFILRDADEIKILTFPRKRKSRGIFGIIKVVGCRFAPHIR